MVPVPLGVRSNSLGLRVPDGDNSKARSMACRSSRTFPGHEWALRVAMTSGVSSGGGKLYRAASDCAKDSANKVRSSPRSLSGGSLRAITFRR